MRLLRPTIAALLTLTACSSNPEMPADGGPEGSPTEGGGPDGGGAAIALGERFLAAIGAGTRESALPVMDPVVVSSRLGAAAGVVGAGLLALDWVGETVDRPIMR